MKGKTMKCYNCKKEVPDDIQYCPDCGYSQQFSQDLIDRAINKDSAAEDQLYYMTYNNVFFTIRALVKDEDTIHDLTQDTYIKAYRNLSQLKEPAAFRGWIKRIAHNLTIDYLRKRKPKVFSDMVVSSNSVEMIEFPDERTESMPEAIMDQRETKRLMDEILNSLSDEQRVTVSMFYYQQKSIKEISEELGISENTIKSRLFHGRNKIEVEVKELEKKGTKLYGLAPIPFLLLLFRSVDAQAAELPNQEILQTVKEQYNSGTAGTEEIHSETASTDADTPSCQSGDSSGIATEVTKTAIKTASQKGIIIKIFAGIVAASIIGGAIVGLTHNKDNNEQQNVVKPAQAVGEAELSEDNYTDMEEPTQEAREPMVDSSILIPGDPDFITEAQKFVGSYESNENGYKAIEITISEIETLNIMFESGNPLEAFLGEAYGIKDNQILYDASAWLTLNTDGSITITELDADRIDPEEKELCSQFNLTFTKTTPEAVAERITELSIGREME